MEKIQVQLYHAPCGDLRLGSFRGRLCLCHWVNAWHPGRVERRLATGLGAECVEGISAITVEAARQLDAYFRRELTSLDVPLWLVGSGFQREVWQQLQEIPYGQVWTYAGLAEWMGRCRAVRAVANAVGANGLSLFIPCHRVIGSNRSLTGYAGGVEAKRFLLDLEQGAGGRSYEGKWRVGEK